MGSRYSILGPLLALLLSVASSGGADEALALPEPHRQGSVSVEKALAQRRSIRDFAPDPLSLAAISQLLWAAQGITDPKGLRTAPSAGALYPLEVYLIAGAVSGARPGVYRYHPGQHRLVLQSEGDLRSDVADAALEQGWIADAPAILLIGAVFERTARKYGGRAQRYVHMEVGHAAQNVYLQAVAMDLGTTIVGAFRDRPLARVLDLPNEIEPLGLMPLGRAR